MLIPSDPEGARGGCLGVRLLASARILARRAAACAAGCCRHSDLRLVISWNEVFTASVLTVRHKTLTAYLLSVLSESPLHVQFAGGFVLIIPSVLFLFLVRKRLFSMWGVANR